MRLKTLRDYCNDCELDVFLVNLPFECMLSFRSAGRREDDGEEEEDRTGAL